MPKWQTHLTAFVIAVVYGVTAYTALVIGGLLALAYGDAYIPTLSIARGMTVLLSVSAIVGGVVAGCTYLHNLEHIRKGD